MAESFLDMCWNAKNEEAVSNGSNTDAGKHQPDAHA